MRFHRVHFGGWPSKTSVSSIERTRLCFCEKVDPVNDREKNTSERGDDDDDDDDDDDATLASRRSAYNDDDDDDDDDMLRRRRRRVVCLWRSGGTREVERSGK